MSECIGKSHRDNNEIMVVDLIMLRIVSPRGKNGAPQSTNAEEHIRRLSALFDWVFPGSFLITFVQLLCLVLNPAGRPFANSPEGA
jgi:hypothetical protein